MAAADDIDGRVPRTQDLGTIDGSTANLVRQLLVAVAGTYVAFTLAEWSTSRLPDGLGGIEGIVARGGAFVVLGAAALYLTSARPIRSALRTHRLAIEDHERSLESRTEQHVLVGRLQAAFEMAESDHDAFEVVTRALGAVTDAPAELLLADSSRAHLRRVATSPAGGGSGCGVDTPWSCPAVRRSRTMVFGSSDDLDACPHLRDREGAACSAMCVPVTVLGTPMGVLHTTGPGGTPPGEGARSELEAVAEQAGSRIGVLRAMAAAELQATTDPLTGLLNRRCLEAEMASLRDRHVHYAVAFIDLDHFKVLNDTHGHETGDRALRSFARLLRRSVRDGDLVCRYGGEEFVAVFPEAGTAEAEMVVNRVVDELATAVRSGDVPPFTVSVGVAAVEPGCSQAEALRDADEAMFRAKRTGRNRVVVAAEGAGPAHALPERSVPSTQYVS